MIFILYHLYCLNRILFSDASVPSMYDVAGHKRIPIDMHRDPFSYMKIRLHSNSFTASLCPEAPAGNIVSPLQITVIKCFQKLYQRILFLICQSEITYVIHIYIFRNFR